MQNSYTSLKNKKGRNLVVISGYYGYDNLGDEAILEELICELAELLPLQEIVVLSNNPQKTAKLFQVQAVNRWSVRDLLLVLSRAKLFISGGGGLFQDATGGGSVIYYGSQILAARLMGVPVLIYAQGLGPFKRFATKCFTRVAWKAALAASVRDQDSFDLARKWGIDCQLTADPVWLLKPPYPSLELGSDKGKRCFTVGISLRKGTALSENQLSLLPQILFESFGRQTQLLMLPFKKNDDWQILRNLAQGCQNLGIATSMVGPEDFARPSDWLELLAKVDMLVGMRFHALLMALKVGKPVVGIPYDPKVVHLCNSFQQPLLTLSETENGAMKDAWLHTLKAAYNNRVELKMQAQAITLKMQEKSCQNSQMLGKLLKS